ncbi:MAG: cellulase family glycosylhydrolase [Thermoguttaceae bacterium]|nr:cellulase family glycosylhydrolase [Thermoguttaceae bacterium]
MQRRDFLTKTAAVAVLATHGMGMWSGASSMADSDTLLPDAAWNQLPRWRGFNLLEKFMRPSGNKRFVEDDFRMMHDWGFNFVRLPMDYRNWIVGGDWERIDESVLAEIDEAVTFGERYGVHICMNFHRAPGYTVAQPPEAKNLWIDPDAKRVCALHWRKFANRYRDLPNSRVSFNLFNEPSDVPMAAYVETVRLICDAIREESPERLIICDGTSWGMKPCMELLPLRVAQATRGYAPMEISHYRASWVQSQDFPTPRWPMPSALSGGIYGSFKPELQTPLLIDGPFPAAMRLRVRVGTVSSRAQFVVTADDRPIFEKLFVPTGEKGYGEGGSSEWEKAIFFKEWNGYQNLYNVDYRMEIPAGTKRVELRVEDGDWLRLREIGLTPLTVAENATAAPEVVQPFRDVWGEKPPKLTWNATQSRFDGGMAMDRAWLRKNSIEPWKKAEAAGLGVIVGEFGAHCYTPHEVVLAWLEDNLANWKEAGWGWAMWNLRGSFGILDSNREDVKYENFHGHQLDRKMLELLQRY